MNELGRGDDAAGLLPVHGFVLAGGKSSRMGRDKVLLAVGGRSMGQIAVEKLAGFCAEVSIAGNRPELRSMASVVEEARQEVGPVGGIEAGLLASCYPWAMFLPVDVPFVPEALLRRWADQVLARERDGLRLSFLSDGGDQQPTFCMLHRACRPLLSHAIELGGRKLRSVFEQIETGLGYGSLWIAETGTLISDDLCSKTSASRWFFNINTPEDLAGVEVPLGSERGPE
ncbi:MAG TPA: molybdenum cofactor guanylyltransferase [Acidobacteriaceae bacterium]|nr:molybdenum cofactor guanylyltransferase [Acidobacteriaceae bacterium]